MHKLRANVDVSRGALLKQSRADSQQVHTSLESQLLNTLAISPVRVETLE